MHLEPQVSCLQNLTRLDIVRARDDASTGALTALTALQQLRLRGCSYTMARSDRDVGWHDRDFAPLLQLSRLEGFMLTMLPGGAAVKPTDIQACILSRQSRPALIKAVFGSDAHRGAGQCVVAADGVEEAKHEQFAPQRATAVKVVPWLDTAYRVGV